MITGEQAGSAPLEMQPSGLSFYMWTVLAQLISESVWVGFFIKHSPFILCGWFLLSSRGTLHNCGKRCFYFLLWQKKINYFCQKGSLCMFSRLRAWVSQVRCLMFAPCCLQAVVSDEHDAQGLPTLNPRTSQHSLMFAFLFSDAGLNLHCAEFWCSERNKTAQPKKHPACLCCVECSWLSVPVTLQCRHNALLCLSKTLL